MLKSLNYSKYTKNMNILEIFIAGVEENYSLFNCSLFAGESETNASSSNKVTSDSLTAVLNPTGNVP